MHNVHTCACPCMYAARLLKEREVTGGVTGVTDGSADTQVTMLLETAMARQRLEEPLVIVVDNVGHLYNVNDCEQRFNSELLLVTDYTQVVDADTQTDRPPVDTTDEVSIFISSFLCVSSLISSNLLTGLNYYGLLKPSFYLISMCMCSQYDSTSLPVQRSQINFF